MNKRQLGALLAVNLRLVNPQATTRLRKKGSTGKALTKRLSYQFLLSAVLFVFIYGATIIFSDFSKLPGMFTFYVALFVLLAFSQSISAIYNVFFAGKDLNSYLPLPFKQNEIFLSKILITTFNILPFTLPMLLVFFTTGWRAGMVIPLAVILAIVVYLLVIAIVLAVCSLIVFGLTKTKLFRKNQSLVMNILIGVSMIVAIGGILLMNQSQASSSSIDRAVIPLFMPLFEMFKEPLSLISGLSWLGLIVLLLIPASILKIKILPKLSEQLTQASTTSSSGSKKHKHQGYQSIRQVLDSYNLQLLKEPNLLLQVVMNSVMIPLIFVFTFSFAKLPTDLPMKWMGVFFIAGISFSLFTTNQASLISNLISLDRMNFEFVKALPISMSYYLKRKFKLGFIFQLILNVVMLLIMAVILKAGLVMTLMLVLGTVVGTYLISQHFFIRDYRLRLDNWTNVTELFSRGGGNFIMMLSMFLSVIVAGILIAVYSVLLFYIPQSGLVNLAAVVIILLTIFFVLRYYRKFWNQFK